MRISRKVSIRISTRRAPDAGLFSREERGAPRAEMPCSPARALEYGFDAQENSQAWSGGSSRKQRDEPSACRFAPAQPAMNPIARSRALLRALRLFASHQEHADNMGAFGPHISTHREHNSIFFISIYNISNGPMSGRSLHFPYLIY